MANANKQYIKNTIPQLKDAVERCVKKMRINWDDKKRVEETTRLICIQSHKFTDFDNAYRYAQLLEMQLKAKRYELKEKYDIDNVVKEEFKKIISFPVSFKSLKELLFFGKKKQVIQCRTYQNMNDVLKILLGLADFLEGYYYEEAYEGREALDLIYEDTSITLSLAYNMNKIEEVRRMEYVKANGNRIEKQKEIHPSLFLFSIIVFLNYWDKFCKEVNKSEWDLQKDFLES